MEPVFEWDSRKAEVNRRKHRVAFEEAITVFADPLARIFDDPDHSNREHREIIAGFSSQERLLLVSFTERADRIRIINARVATPRERRAHEEGTQER
jgi:hypothetical protein